MNVDFFEMGDFLKKIKMPAFIIFLAMITSNCQDSTDELELENKIKVWYGSEQSFGINGYTQRQINVLGTVQSDNEQIKAYYTLNDNDEKSYLRLGSDRHRLAHKGDFNIEINRSRLLPGENTINIFISVHDNIIETMEVTVNYYPQIKMHLPHYVNWDNINRIQDAVDVVDGEWELTESGVRVKNRYYDRIVAFGDSSWKSYEVETSVIFHDYTPPTPGPPSYNVSHVAIATRWPGHDKDNQQPNRKWYPLGATAEFRITDNYDSCSWRIFDGENVREEQSVDEYRQISPEVKYKMKHRVESISKTDTRYSVKFWKAGEQEPSTWDLQTIELNDNVRKGSVCLIAHHTKVTFGNIVVMPVNSEFDE